MPLVRPQGGRPCLAILQPMRLCLLVLAVFGLLSQAAAHTAAHESPMRASFFDSVEVRTDNISAFRKWRDALRRSAAETADAVDGDCDGDVRRPCPYHDWLRFLSRLHGRDRSEQLRAVNVEMNTRHYVSDTVNYGQEDHWASVGEFLTHGSGDCEDYAIAKFLSLKRLGWSDRELRLVAVRDLRLGTGHALLIAFLDGKAWLLDNQIGQVMDSQGVHHYQPLYSINETSWWQHQPRGWSDSAAGNPSVGGPAAR